MHIIVTHAYLDEGYNNPSFVFYTRRSCPNFPLLPDASLRERVGLPSSLSGIVTSYYGFPRAIKRPFQSSNTFRSGRMKHTEDLETYERQGFVCWYVLNGVNLLDMSSVSHQELKMCIPTGTRNASEPNQWNQAIALHPCQTTEARK